MLFILFFMFLTLSPTQKGILGDFGGFWGEGMGFLGFLGKGLCLMYE